MPEYLKRDPAGVPQEITNRFAKRLFADKDKTDGYAALGNLHQLGADSSGNPADSSGDTDAGILIGKYLF